MEYNTVRPPMVIREYGRSVQKMIEFACTIEDREKRNSMAQSIIRVMSQISPQQGDANEWKQKLYDHLFLISNFKLDIDSPYPIPSQAALHQKPEKVPYPSNGIRMKHYGRSLQRMIVKASEYPEGEEKKALIRLLLIQMKRAYMVWNHSSLNDDSLIAEQLYLLSDGKITYTPDMQVDFTPELPDNNIKKKKKHKKFKKK